MGSNLNFKNMGDGPPESNGGGSGAGGGRAPGIFPLARQTSIYSLTFDEFQNSMGGVGKDFGSMNMDELLRNIWTAEEAQVMGMASSSFGGSDGGIPGANLQRQGSLTLPRTLSTKTVDEVWRDLYKESGGGCGSGGGGSSGGGSSGGGGKDENVVVNGGTGLQQRQQTLGEMTLEDFLVRAGVVREETQSVGRPNSNGFYGELYSTNNNGSLGLGFGQPNRANGLGVNRVIENNNPLTNQNPTLGINLNGTITSQQQQQNRQPQQILPKQTPIPYASPLNLTNNSQLANQGMGGGVVGLGETMMTNGFVQGGGGGRVGGGGVGGLGAGAVTIATVTPANPPSSNGFGKINGNNSTLLPGPYVFNGTLRGKRSGAVEKVVERRQRRMIKNRESAARSRARKQAYTMELEEEVAKLKEENQELQKKQAETMEMQKQALEMMNQKAGAKRRCLRRTLTGPW